MYILKNPESFNLKQIFESGQCFRWTKQDDDSYIGVVSGFVLKVEKEKSIVKNTDKNIDYKFTSSLKDSTHLEEFVFEYFDLGTNYTKIKEEVLEMNSTENGDICKPENKRIIEHNLDLEKAIQYGSGIRILKQELWETIVTYIISANNNIPRIKGIIEKLSKEYGREISFEGSTYYSFPTPKELEKATVEDFRRLGLGFRDKRVYDIVRVFLKEDIKEYLENEKHDLNILKTKLLEYNGIGPKVADCILLFGLSRHEVFPVDVWVRRVMNDIYFKKSDEKKLSDKEILEFVNRRYGKSAGIIQQYLFYWKRETHGE